MPRYVNAFIVESVQLFIVILKRLSMEVCIVKVEHQYGIYLILDNTSIWDVLPVGAGTSVRSLEMHCLLACWEHT